MYVYRRSYPKRCSSMDGELDNYKSSSIAHGINICFWATELEIGDSSSKAYPSSSHNSTRRILSNRARHKWLELESLPELESQPL